MDQELTEITERVMKKARPFEGNTPGLEKRLTPEGKEKRVIKSGTAIRFRSASMGDFGEETISLCNGFIEKKVGGLFIHGPAGTGKTHLAIAAMKEAMDAEFPKEWENTEGAAYFPRERVVTVPWLLMEIRSSFKSTSSESEYELIKDYGSVPLLVLDDLGAEKGSEFAIQTLYLIIDRRYSELRRTIITSNLSIGEVAEKIGDRIASRIAGMCKVIELKGPDRRIAV